MKRCYSESLASSRRRGAALFAVVLAALVLAFSAVDADLSRIYAPVGGILLVEGDASNTHSSP